MFFPLVEANHADDFPEHLLEGRRRGRVGPIQGALDYHGVELGEDLVLLEHHGPRPRTVINCKIQDPFVGSCAPDVDQKFLQVLLGLKIVLVVECHLGDGDNFAALCEEYRDADVLGEGQ